MKVTRKSHDATTLFYHSSELSSFWYSSSGSFLLRSRKLARCHLVHVLLLVRANKPIVGFCVFRRDGQGQCSIPMKQIVCVEVHQLLQQFINCTHKCEVVSVCVVNQPMFAIGSRKKFALIQ